MARKTWRVGEHTFLAADYRDGVLVDPDLPASFDSTANEERPASHRKFWLQPYVVPRGGEHPSWVLRCLDGGAWDRSTNWGTFPTIEAAVAEAKLRVAQPRPWLTL